jgi:hypothetical protein
MNWFDKFFIELMLLDLADTPTEEAELRGTSSPNGAARDYTPQLAAPAFLAGGALFFGKHSGIRNCPDPQSKTRFREGRCGGASP